MKTKKKSVSSKKDLSRCRNVIESRAHALPPKARVQFQLLITSLICKVSQAILILRATLT